MRRTHSDHEPIRWTCRGIPGKFHEAIQLVAAWLPAICPECKVLYETPEKQLTAFREKYPEVTA